MSGNLTLGELIERATGGITFDKKQLLKPSMAYPLLEDPHALWCDYHAPEKEKVDEQSRYDKLRMQWGVEFEEAWVAKKYPHAVKIKRYWGLEALEETCRAMLSGAHAIHAPLLWLLPEGMYGKGDLIVRSDDAPSDLGAFHYRVIEVKHSKAVKEYHILQTVLYNRIIAALQGYKPPFIEIALKSGIARQAVREHEAAADNTIRLWKEIRAGRFVPELPVYNDASSPWRLYTNRILEERRDLTLCPVIHLATTRKKLRERLGIGRVEELDRLGSDDFVKALGPKDGIRIFHKFRAYKEKLSFVIPGERPEIPRRNRRLYFDFETSMSEHPTIPPHIYMVGVHDREADEFRVFVAKGMGEEEKTFAEFLDYVGDPVDAALYHWTRFEIKEMNGLKERAPTLRAGIDRLIGACVDLKACVAGKVIFPTPTYSIKEVAPHLGFRWKQEDVDARESSLLYWEWLADGDQRKMDRVIQYNKDDCLAMLHIDKVLEKTGA